jgi:hypothetical protein
MAAKDRRGHGRADKDSANAATAEHLQRGHAEDPDEVHVAVAELDARQAYRDRGPSSGGRS